MNARTESHRQLLARQAIPQPMDPWCYWLTVHGADEGQAVYPCELAPGLRVMVGARLVVTVGGWSMATPLRIWTLDGVVIGEHLSDAALRKLEAHWIHQHEGMSS